MQRYKRLAVIVFVASLASATWAQSGTNYLILAHNQGTGSTAFASRLAAAGGIVTGNFEAIGVITARSANPSFGVLANALPGVQAVSEDPKIPWYPNEKVVKAAARPVMSTVANQETFSGVQWNLRQIHADVAAANNYRGWNVARARVAVLDSGIITTHPDIAPNLNLTLSTSFVDDEPYLNPPAGEFNHGTHVAGIIAAPVNDYGVQGVAPDAEIVAVKVLGWEGSGDFGAIIAGLLYASAPPVHADVINMSLGAAFYRPKVYNCDANGCWNPGPLMAALDRAVNFATQRGTLVISSAGNNGANLNSLIVSIPAESGNGMAVAATGPFAFGYYGDAANFDRPASYTNYGQSVISVAAPGGDALLWTPDSTGPGFLPCTQGGITDLCWAMDMVISPAAWTYDTDGTTKLYWYSWAAGTSMAAPHVAGVAALIVGAYGHLPPAIIRSLLQQSSDDILKPGADAYSGTGRINAARALGLH